MTIKNMKDLKYPKSFPNKKEDSFLRMLLSDRKDFPELYRQWKEQIVFASLDKARLKLIPFLYLRLKELDTPDEEIKVIKGVYKFTWYKNLLIMDTVRKVISSFIKEDIPVILLKGVPLLVNAYNNTGARALGDADILIDPRHVEKALKIMNANDWKYLRPWPFLINSISGPHPDRYFKEITFINMQKITIDMHFNLFDFSVKDNKRHPMSYDEVFQYAVDFSLKGVGCRVPCNEDMIIHIIAHGAHQNVERTLRWVLDVATIIRSVEIDWEFLLKRIKKFDLAVELNVAFSYLFRNHSIPVPESFINRLSQLPMERRNIKNYYKNATNIEHMLFGSVSILWRVYWRDERKGNLFTSWFYFIDFACKGLGIRNKWHLPAFIMGKYKNRIVIILNKYGHKFNLNG
jgi:hypothetical protein